MTRSSVTLPVALETRRTAALSASVYYIALIDYLQYF